LKRELLGVIDTRKFCRKSNDIWLFSVSGAAIAVTFLGELTE